MEQAKVSHHKMEMYGKRKRVDEFDYVWPVTVHNKRKQHTNRNGSPMFVLLPSQDNGGVGNEENSPTKQQLLDDITSGRSGERTPHSNESENASNERDEGKSSTTTTTTNTMVPLTPVRARDIPFPAVSWADSSELSLLMYFKEEIVIKERNPELFKKHKHLTPRMRSILFDWLMEVCEVYKLRRVTYYLAVDYVDRYLSQIDQLPKQQLQLLGITCLFMAAKVEEIYPPKLLELAYVTDGACTDKEMLLIEMAVLKTLKWDVNAMTVSSWLYLYLQMCQHSSSNIRMKADNNNSAVEEEEEEEEDDDDNVVLPSSKCDDDFIYPQVSGYAFRRASQLIDLCSLDEGMLLFQYSVIAAAAIYYVFNRETALRISGYMWDQISHCVDWMAPFVTVVNRSLLTTPLIVPKDYQRTGAGLKRYNPNIVLDETHTLQTHAVDLKMLDEAYQIMYRVESVADDESLTERTNSCSERNSETDSESLVSQSVQEEEHNSINENDEEEEEEEGGGDDDDEENNDTRSSICQSNQFPTSLVNSDEEHDINDQLGV